MIALKFVAGKEKMILTKKICIFLEITSKNLHSNVNINIELPMICRGSLTLLN